MSLFFSGAVTSSPIKRTLRGSHFCQSLDVSLLSPDSSYLCYPSATAGGEPSCCRRSPRLLTNGYYVVTEDSFSRDGDGNVTLTLCEATVCYKENRFRVWRRRRRRRRRRPRGSLARLLSHVTESCQSWLDQRVFRGVFRTDQDQDWVQVQDQDQDQDWVQDQDWDWAGTSQEGPASLDESSWSRFCSTELDDSCSFMYDHTEIPPPDDKVDPPPKMLFQEEICSEICQSKEQFPQSLGGLSEVPPPSPHFTSSCRRASPERAGLRMKALLLFVFALFILTALYSGSLLWSSAVVSMALAAIFALMRVTGAGPAAEWRRAKTKTEDITSRNE